MKIVYLLLLLFILCGCKKFLSQPPGKDHRQLQQGDATVTERYAPGCYPQPVMLRLEENVKNYLPFYQDNKGNFDPYDDETFWPDLREVYAHNLPDSLFAPGQRLKILFRTYEVKHWWSCNYRKVPNMIGLHGVLVVYFEDELEVTALDTRCEQLVEVKVTKPYPPYLGASPVMASRVPDSLKTVGRRFRCTYRLAGRNEHKGCWHSSYETQLVINEIR